MKDFTKAQALQWVAQESMKATTPEKIAARIKSERTMIAVAATMDPPLPNSAWAHRELLRRLEKLEKL